MKLAFLSDFVIGVPLKNHVNGTFDLFNSTSNLADWVSLTSVSFKCVTISTGPSIKIK
jgi:hypothetical protein